MWEKLKKQAFKSLTKLVKDHGYSYVAYKLGYKSSSTIEAWVKRKSVPNWCLDKVENLRLIEEKRAS